ncbi:hypothetical protein MRB53_031970 [Persea americana]|uniref:Uncharacterized protein n=1 Tax=Persea americana TaxID=3435 RepID=A0ACC2KQG8_PERAE|nr:hypothetical protein MRB53_031970 [Persea americana]
MERVVEKTYSSNLEERCTVKFSEQCIFTTITSTASVVDEWISEIRRIYGQITIVGLDTEWCLPKEKGKCGPVAIIQLCVGTRCLIFQLILADVIPESLKGFLADPTLKFVGVAVAGDAQKLWDEYGLIVGSTEDLAAVAALKLGEEKLKEAGLKRLASIVLGVEMEKPKRVILSTWNARVLNLKQIHYASVDAFVSFEIGKCLMI